MTERVYSLPSLDAMRLDVKRLHGISDPVQIEAILQTYVIAKIPPVELAVASYDAEEKRRVRMEEAVRRLRSPVLPGGPYPTDRTA